MRRLTGLLALTATLAITGTGIATGETVDAACTPQASAWAQPDSAGAGLNCDGTSKPTEPTNSPAKQGKGGSTTKPLCVWVPKPDYQPAPSQKTDGDGGHWYTKFCSFGEYKTLADFEREMGSWDAMNTRQSNMMQRAGLETRFFTTPPPVPRRTPEQVMASVVGNLPFPKTFIAVNPVPAKQVVGVPTWVWLTDENGKFDPKRYDKQSKEIELEGYQLKWQIAPQLTVSPGAGGEKQTCNGAGVPYSAAAETDAEACTVTYERAGKYTLSASVGWTVRWWLAGVPQPDIAGPTNTATQALTVLEIQALAR